MKAIKNGIVFSPDGFVEKIDVILQEGKILGMAHCLSSFDGEVIDAKGGYVLPGFIDIHMHGIAGHDIMEGTDESILAMIGVLPEHGVTSFLPTTVTAPALEIRQALSIISKYHMQHTGGAVILGCHLEGPFINPKYKGAHVEEYIQPPEQSFYREMVGEYGNLVRLITMAPELTGAEEFIKFLRDEGITVSCGHSGANYRLMEDAIKWGATHTTHLFNAMPPIHHREPGIIGAALDHEEVTVELIADMIHLHPATIRMATRTKGWEKCVLITDAMMATGLGNGVYELGGQKVFVNQGVARVKEGNLAGSTLTLDQAVRNMIKTVKMPPEQVIPMVSSNPAKVIGEGLKRGKIAQGYEADICIMDKDWNVIETLIGGEVCYCKNE